MLFGDTLSQTAQNNQKLMCFARFSENGVIRSDARYDDMTIKTLRNHCVLRVHFILSLKSGREL